MSIAKPALRFEEGLMRGSILRVSAYAFGLLLTVCSMPATVVASSTVGVPEIDGTGIVTALGALAAGVLLLRARKSR
jgi:hypothetical protein